jgi:PleD family two-component response regulator
MSTEGHSPAPTPRILIANDQEWTARSLESILAAEGYEVARAFTGRQALERALELCPDLIILDTQLPDISGPEICRRLRDHAAIGWSVPIIVTTAGTDARSAMAEAIEAGAWDFATQPFDGPSLLARIRTYLQSKAAFDAAKADAVLDPATGLYNRRGLALRVSELLADARRRRERVTCMVVSARTTDVPHTIEARSAEALMAGALRAAVRGSDAVARLATLHFVVVAPNLDGERARKVVERFRRRLTTEAGDHGLAIPIQVGVAQLGTEDGIGSANLLQRALTTMEPDALSLEEPVPAARRAAI